MPPLATLAGVRAFEADGTYQPPAIESGRWLMMVATATVKVTARPHPDQDEPDPLKGGRR